MTKKILLSFITLLWASSSYANPFAGVNTLGSSVSAPSIPAGVLPKLPSNIGNNAQNEKNIVSNALNKPNQTKPQTQQTQQTKPVSQTTQNGVLPGQGDIFNSVVNKVRSANDVKTYPAEVLVQRDKLPTVGIRSLPPSLVEKDGNLTSDGREVKFKMVYPEITTPVDLSSMDVNRFACGGKIGDIIFSQEKGVKVVKAEDEKNAFIKYLVGKQNGQDVFATTPTEFYVVCDGAVFNLIGIPKRMPSQTVHLVSGSAKLEANAKSNMELMGGLPFETKIINLIKYVYKDEIPESFIVKQYDKPAGRYKDVSIKLVKVVGVEGEGVQVKELLVSNISRESKKIELHEKEFLKPEITVRPVAISMEKAHINKGETIRVFVVESTTEVKREW